MFNSSELRELERSAAVADYSSNQWQNHPVDNDQIRIDRLAESGLEKKKKNLKTVIFILSEMSCPPPQVVSPEARRIDSP